jgi:hypothetical protein
VYVVELRDVVAADEGGPVYIEGSSRSSGGGVDATETSRSCGTGAGFSIQAVDM